MSRLTLRRNLVRYLVALAATSATTAVVVALSHYVSIPNISLLYLPVILMTAVYFGTGPSLLAATAAVLEYDFFLLQPLFTFTIKQAQDVVAFVIFVIVAVLTSQLAASARTRAEAAQRRAAESETLYLLERALMSGDSTEDILQAITQRIVELFELERCAIFVPDGDGQLRLAAETRRTAGVRDRASEAAAAWVFREGTEVGLPNVQGNRSIYVPLRTSDRTVGVMELGPTRSGERLDEEGRSLISSFATQASLVIERTDAREERQRLRVLEETDRLKSALLSAVSHDLRTPLASIKASATALLLADGAVSSEQGREFLQAIDDQADRLNRLVGNLLDLSRIEAGALHPVLEWYAPQEIVDALLPRLTALLGDRPHELSVEPDLPPVQLDLLRIEELVLNLVENAVKYSPPGSPVELHIRQAGDQLRLEVVDHGPGIPPRYRQRIFESFYRLRQHSDRDRGTGLGLAISRGIVEAHGGAIHVEDTPSGGATFVVTLPLSAAPPAVPA